MSSREPREAPTPYRLERMLLVAAVAVAAVLTAVYLLLARDETVLLIGNGLLLVVLVYDLLRGQRRRVVARLDGERQVVAGLEARIERAQEKSQGKN